MSAPLSADAAFAKVEMAGVYVDDGAFLSAARCLREATDILEGVARSEREALDAFCAGEQP